jgi:branched-chain amino acid transport system substrate-binding protein
MVKGKINQSGGIIGKQLKFIYDDTGKPDVGRASAEKLINKQISSCNRGYSSSFTSSACAVAQQYKIPFLVNTGSADKITHPEAFNLKPNVGDKFYIYR